MKFTFPKEQIKERIEASLLLFVTLYFPDLYMFDLLVPIYCCNSWTLLLSLSRLLALNSVIRGELNGKQICATNANAFLPEFDFDYESNLQMEQLCVALLQ